MLRRRISRSRAWRGLLVACAPLLLAGCSAATTGSAAAAAPAASVSAPGVQLQVGGVGDNAAILQLFVLMTVLSLVPAILVMVTSFVRISVVLGFLRNAIGVPSLPPNQVLLGLSLFLTIFVMAPTWQAINTQALQPYLQGQMPADQAFDAGSQPLREFMFKQVREKDLALFIQLGNLPRPNTEADVPTFALVPAFMISELQTAFQMGFMILVPFLVIDLVVSSVLTAMGMMMLPPATISLPFKILLFVMADGWHLIAQSLISSFS